MFSVPVEPVKKKAPAAPKFGIDDMIIRSELSSKVRTTNWINRANIATPNFKLKNVKEGNAAEKEKSESKRNVEPDNF